MCDSATQPVMVIPIAITRSITTPDCNAMLHTNLQEVKATLR
jgi:hypothetical protein